MDRGRVDEAITQYELALRAGSGRESHRHLSPAIVENSLGNALAQKNEVELAIDHYRRALQLRRDFTDARSNLAAMLARKGELSAAISEYQQVVDTPPEEATYHQRLAGMLVKANREREALVHYRRAAELAPASLDALNALAWMLARSSDPGIHNPVEALRIATHANRVSRGTDPVVLRVLAASYAGSGQPNKAVAAVQQALPLTPAYPGLGPLLTAELARYRALLRSNGLTR
jgi:tetratricopeptide (TPR) repeat protein